MKFETPKNPNYIATVVKIQAIVPIKNCDNVVHAIILGNRVIVDKSHKVGDVGLYFPVESQLSKEYLTANSLYTHKELNADVNKKGYFEINGRVRCVKFRGNDSEGIFMPLESLLFIDNFKISELSIGDEFDQLMNIEICRKYVKVSKDITATPITSKKRQSKWIRKLKSIFKSQSKSKTIDGQFKFHRNTPLLYKSAHRIDPNVIISVTYKMHGTSCVSSNLLCKKKLTKFENILKKLGINIVNTHYDYLHSSRSIIKNDKFKSPKYHRKDVYDYCNDFLINSGSLAEGLSFYYEIVGYTSSGRIIQKLKNNFYDYGYTQPTSTHHDLCESGDLVTRVDGKKFKSNLTHNTVKSIIKHPKTNISSYTFYEDDSILSSDKCHKDYFKIGVNCGIYIYRITYTNPQGKVFEFSAKQLKDYCNNYGLNTVPELYNGTAKQLFDTLNTKYNQFESNDVENFGVNLLNLMKLEYTNKDCFMCKETINPEEGVVVRIDKFGIEAYKLKSSRFLELETASLDSGETNIEDQQTEFETKNTNENEY